MGEETFFSLFSLLFIIFGFGFGFVFLFIIIKVVKAVKVNNKFPQITVPVKIVSKRKYYNKNNYPNCYVTFKFESDDTMEFVVPEPQFELMLNGDEGALTFKGNTFISFD